MNVLTDPFTPATFPDLFTWMWVGGIGISIGAIFVYNLAQRRYRRYPARREDRSRPKPTPAGRRRKHR